MHRESRRFWYCFAYDCYVVDCSKTRIACSFLAAYHPIPSCLVYVLPPVCFNEGSFLFLMGLSSCRQLIDLFPHSICLSTDLNR